MFQYGIWVKNLQGAVELGSYDLSNIEHRIRSTLTSRDVRKFTFTVVALRIQSKDKK